MKALINSWISQINGYIYEDGTVDNIVTDELYKYFSNQQTAEETVTLIQRRADMYFNQ